MNAMDSFKDIYRITEDDIRASPHENWNWPCISRFLTMSCDFMEEFSEKLNWSFISRFQQLPDELIERFRDRLDWETISYSQDFSEEFMKRNKDRIVWLFLRTENIRRLKDFEFLVEVYPKLMKQRAARALAPEVLDKLKLIYI